MKKILIIEDEEDIIELIRYNLSKEGYNIDQLLDGTHAVDYVARTLPDLILLDLMLPGMDGLDICRGLKAHPKTAGISIIMVTAKSDESDIVAGLELGAEDYMTKPFSVKVLTARVRSVFRRNTLRHTEQTVDDYINIHKLKIFPNKRKLLVNNTELVLTFSEFQTLLILATQPGRVFTRYQIVENVHGNDYAVTDRSIDVLMVSLRKKLGRYADYIETIRGVGYRFKDA